MKPSSERSSTHSRTIIIFIIENNKYIEFQPDYFSPQQTFSIHPVRARHARNQTNLFLSKSETFLLEPPPYLFPRDSTRSSPGTILKLCAQCPRRHGTKGPSCSSINRPDEIPGRPIHASKSWKPEDSGFHRDRERWKPFDESRLRIYGGTLLKRPSPLSLSRPFIPRICFTVPFGESCRRFPIRHLLTAASRMRRTMAAALFDCNSFFPSVSQWRRKLGSLNGANSRAASHLYARHLSGDRLMDGCLQFRSRLDTLHFNERVTNDDAFSLIVFVFLPLSLLRIICRSIGSNGRNFLVSFFFLLYLIENCFIYSSY